jgi:histone H3/H4
MVSSKLSISSMRRLCRKSGAKRVSDAAAERLAEILEQLGMKLAREAFESAKLEGRKTVRLEDVDAAVRKVMGRSLLFI